MLPMQTQNSSTIMLCLATIILGRMEKGSRKYERNLIGMVFGWKDERERKLVRLNYFIFVPTKIQFLQI